MKKPQAKLKIPLDTFSSKNISFTYPDSFFSDWRNKSHPLYDAELNGKVFSLEQILDLLRQHAIPEDVYMDSPDCHFHFYVEAQVWDYHLFDTIRI